MTYKEWRYIEGGDKSKYSRTGISVHRLRWVVSEVAAVSWGGGDGGQALCRDLAYNFITLHSSVSR